MPDIALLLGSTSDQAVMKAAEEYLVYFGLSFEWKVSSAHRQPEETAEYARALAGRGVKVVIAAAGMAAHLPGFVASVCPLPVIGVPLEGSPLQGVDALYSIVQMPAGVPVATMAIGAAGARNAAVLAARIVALADAAVRARLEAFRENGSRIG